MRTGQSNSQDLTTATGNTTQLLVLADSIDQFKRCFIHIWSEGITFYLRLVVIFNERCEMEVSCDI